MGHREVYRAEDYTVDFLPHSRIEFVGSDEEINKAVETLRKAAFGIDIADEGIVVMRYEWQIL